MADFTEDRYARIVAQGSYLYSYMQARTAKEDVSYKLTPEFFGFSIEAGFSVFFGVLADADGYPISDEKEPENGFLDAWKASNPKKPKKD